MARARNIKPGFFTNDRLAECDPLARILFAGLWCIADRAGRLEDRPKRIKAELLPYDSCDADALIEQLAEGGFLERYEADGNRFIQVLNFDKHQNPHVKEAPSAIPAPYKNKESTVQEQCTPDECTEQAGLIPDSLNLIPDSIEEANASVASVPVGPQATTQTACPADSIVALYHEVMPDNPRCKVLSAARRAAIRARWKEAAHLDCEPFGYSTRADGLAAWRRFFEVCAESDFLTGRAPGLPGKPPFIADIDFLMSPSGFAKTLENKYHREVAA